MDPLAQLHDIHLAPAVANYPIAIGWWLLLLLVLTVCFFSIKGLKRWRAKKQFLAQCVSQLEQAQQISDVVALIKGICIRYGLRQQIAAMSLAELFALLIQTLPKAKQAEYSQLIDIDFSLCYQAQSDQQLFSQIKVIAQFWLKHSLPLSANTIEQLKAVPK